MKRWMISACITLFILLAACVISSFFTVEETSFTQSNDSGESTVTVIRKIRPKKQVFRKKENVISSPAAVVNLEPEQIEEAEEETEESEETDDFEGEAETADDVQQTLSAEGQKAEESYKQAVLKKIAAKKVYPLAARAKGQEGKVKIHAVIDVNGSLVL